MLAVVGKCARDGSWGMVCVGRMGWVGGACVRLCAWFVGTAWLGCWAIVVLAIVGCGGVAVLVLPCLERLLLAVGWRGCHCETAPGCYSIARWSCEVWQGQSPPAVAMHAFARLSLWLLCVVGVACAHVDYASARLRVENAYVANAHEMASAVTALLGLTKDTSALIAAIKAQCA